MLFYDQLKNIELEGKIIRVGLVGAGFMGKGIVEVMEYTPGMKVVAVADIDLLRAKTCFSDLGIKDIIEIRNFEDGGKLDFSHSRAVTDDFRIIPRLEYVDFVIEATGVPEVGAEVAFLSILNGKHVGTLNVETDVTVGYYLNLLARKSGVVYTVCAGDEPAAAKELCDFSRGLGFKIVACGKGKNNPLDIKATPESLKEQAEQKRLNPRILTEFVDGSKTMVEMSCLANATGLSIDKRNMHGPCVELDDIVNIFGLEKEGGILKIEGVVDYVVGGIAPGVFAVVSHPGKVANYTLNYLKIGKGPRYLFYRPYHLTSIEVPHSVAQGYFFNSPTIATFSPPSTEVITIAKKNLQKGEIIDYIGGFTVYGGIEKAETARKEKLLPLGLCQGAKIVEDVEMGSALKLHQVELKESFLLQLRRIQERILEQT